jgi:hypothetical protein
MALAMAESPARASGRTYQLPGSGRLIRFEHRRKREFERALAVAAREWAKDGLAPLERPHELLSLQPMWAAALLIAHGVVDGPISLDEADGLIDEAAEAGTQMDDLFPELLAALTGVKRANPPPPPSEAGAGGDES